MRNYFKFLATTLVAILVVCALSAVTFAASTPFTDVDDRDETLSDAVALLSHLGVTKGTSETTFGTIDGVTRQQMSAFIYRLLQAGKSLDGNTVNTTSYKDLVDRTYFGYISWADTMGIIKGTSETTFNPKGGIILQDAYTMIIRALGHEDDSYIYPFTHIEKAEELGLDEGLVSELNYDSILTRGDIAVLLYNTFFAELGKESTRQDKVLISNGEGWVMKKTTYHPTLAEDVYDVELGTFTVRATPKYAFNDSADSLDYTPLVEEYETDMLRLVATAEDEPLKDMICKFEGTGLDGAADDYIMQSVQVYYTYETKNSEKKLDQIYFISHSEKTFETSSLEVDYAKSPYTDEDLLKGYPKATGKMTVGKEVIYFYDAPYSYLKPDYNSIDTEGKTKDEIEEARYTLRNAKNVKLINLKALDTEKGTYSYYIDENQDTDGLTSLTRTLRRVLSKGVYKMKFFDVDGDDIYEYAYYMPATYGFMNGNDRKDFSSVMTDNAPIFEKKAESELDLKFTPTIYYNDAVVTGKKFEDGDFVFAFLNPDANTIEVLGVVQSYKGYVEQVRPTHGRIKIDGTEFSTIYSMRVVENIDDAGVSGNGGYETDNWEDRWHHFSTASTFPDLVGSQKPVGELYEIYYFPFGGLNTVLYFDHLDDASMEFSSSDTLIPVSSGFEKETFSITKYDGANDDDVVYVRVYIDGAIKYVPVDVDEMYPALVYDDGEYSLGFETDTSYVEKISKFVVDSDGKYTIIPLLHATDDKGTYIGIDDDSTVLEDTRTTKKYGKDLGFDWIANINKVAGSKYELVSKNSKESILGDFTGENGGVKTKYFEIKANTRIVIKNWTDRAENEFEYLEFTSTTFKGSVESDLTNIQYILRNNPDSKNCEDLVFLYAEADDFEFKNTVKVDNSWRIVADSNIVKVAEEEYRYSYILLNPYTGETIKDVLGEDYAKKPDALGNPVENGTMIKVKFDKLDEDADVLANIDTSNNEGLVWITEYSADENFISVLPVEAAEDVDCKSQFVDMAQDFAYGVGDDDPELNFDGQEFKTKVDKDGDAIYGEGLYYEVNDDTVITVLTHDEAGVEAITEGTFALADISAIAEQSKEFKGYNEKVLGKNGSYSKEYAPYVKAYVYAEKAKGEGELPVAEYIIIVVNGGEQTIFTDNDSNFIPKTCDNH